MATRAKPQLILIHAEPEKKEYKEYYAKYQKHFQAAADKGLVELLGASKVAQSPSLVLPSFLPSFRKFK